MTVEQHRSPKSARRTLLKTIGLVSFAATASVGTVSGQSETDLIKNWNDLDAVRDDLAGDYALASDLDKDTAGYDEHVSTIEKGWNPIGEYNTKKDTEFVGSFDGQNNSIRDLRIDRREKDEVGLFGVTGEEASIRNVSVMQADIAGNENVGGLVGRKLGGDIVASSVTGTVTGVGQVGGLIGWMENGDIDRSSADIDITGDNQVGGLIGALHDGIVTNSTADGNVDGTTRVGGLVGNSGGRIAASAASSAVTADRWVGGLVGINAPKGLIATSSADGMVNGKEVVGGLVGSNNADSDFASSEFDIRFGIVESSASGTVTGTEGIGGLVGDNRALIVGASATSTATGEKQVGGLVGYNVDEGKIHMSSASGEVTGDERVGGLVGSHHGEIMSSLASVDVAGSERVGGLIGSNIESETMRSWAASRVNTTNPRQLDRGTVGRTFGGLVGQNFDLEDRGPSEVVASYWDKEASGRQTGIGADGDGDVKGLDTSQMQGATAKENMSQLDFEETWQATTNPADYPTLRQKDRPIDEVLSEDTSSEEGSSDDISLDTVPGFGVGSGIASMFATAYILKQRLAEDADW